MLIWKKGVECKMNFKFKKRFGQNFIKQENIVKKISSVIGEKKGSLVIEIGCGDLIYMKI